MALLSHLQDPHTQGVQPGLYKWEKYYMGTDFAFGRMPSTMTTKALYVRQSSPSRSSDIGVLHD